MRMVRLGGLMCLAASMALAACTSTPNPTSTGGQPPPIEQPASPNPELHDTDTLQEKAVTAALDTSAAVADALAVAPPATLTKAVTIDDKGIHIAFKAFDGFLTIVDQLKFVGWLRPGTPRALAVQAGIRQTQALLNSASKAQRIGDSLSYTAALANAKAALVDVRAALSL